MQKILSFLFITLALVACQSLTPVPLATSAPDLAGRSVLIYSRGTGPISYEVTKYDANGIPTEAKTSIDLNMYVSPTGTYTSSVKLVYDALLRPRKTIQVYDQLGRASCCPGYYLFNPALELISEYEYQGTTKNITHEINYTVTSATGERKVASEFFRTFTDSGKLMQEKSGNKVMYEAVYDANDNVLSETLYPASGYTETAFTRRWVYEYDAHNRVLSRRIKDSDSFEANSYDAQGRLVRQVTNLYDQSSYSPTLQLSQSAFRGSPLSQLSDVLIDYGFRQADKRWALSFTYFQGQFRHDNPRVITCVYTGDQKTVAQTTYKLWNDLPEFNQPGFDFSQLPKEFIRTITEKTVQLNNQGRVVSEASKHVFVSDKLSREQHISEQQNLEQTTGSEYASEYSYTYDESGNLTGSRGSVVSPIDINTAGPTPTYEARYKRF